MVMKEGDRSFTIVGFYKPAQFTEKKHQMQKTKAEGGRYIGRGSTAPMDCAKKAMTNVCASKRIHGQCTLVGVMRETTAGSEKKEYIYRMKRVLKSGGPVKITYPNGNVSVNRYDILALPFSM